MRHIERSADLPVTPDTVFAFVSDLSNLPQWQSGVTRAEQLTPGPMAVGSTARVERRLMGQQIEAVFQLCARFGTKQNLRCRHRLEFFL